jgi:cytidylate kinase
VLLSERLPVRALPLAELARRVRDRPAPAGACRVVAVDGRAGAGKSTLARRLATLLPAPVLSMDDLYPGWDGLAEAVPALVAEVLEPLAAGQPALHRRWDWAADRWGDPVDLPWHPFLVVEGVGSGARLAAPYLALLVWVEAPDDVRKERALARDGDVFRPYWDRWALQEEALLARERTRDRADVVVDAAADLPYDPETEVVVRGPGG